MRLATIQGRTGPRLAVEQGQHYIDVQATDHTLPDDVRQLLQMGPAARDAVAHAAQDAGEALATTSRTGTRRVCALGAVAFFPDCAG